MKNWKEIGLILVASAAFLLGAGAGGRAALWTSPEGETTSFKAAQSEPVTFADVQPSAAAEADNGPGCAESALNR
jgi:hypothetical protein